MIAGSKGETIPLDSIQQSHEEDNLFTVKSQSKPGISYTVDTEAGHCSCPSFPRIKSCKHLFAISFYFTDQPGAPTVQSAQVHWLVEAAPESDNTLNSSPSTADRLQPESISYSVPSQEFSIKFQLLIPKLNTVPPETLAALRESVDHILVSSTTTPAASLPPCQPGIPPNITTATEFRKIIPNKKQKRPSKHIDPYSGGERSGKRAKLDAQKPSQPTPSQAASTRLALQPSSSQSASASATTSTPAVAAEASTSQLTTAKRPRITNPISKPAAAIAPNQPVYFYGHPFPPPLQYYPVYHPYPSPYPPPYPFPHPHMYPPPPS
jgi:hypothetical protein